MFPTILKSIIPKSIRTTENRSFPSVASSSYEVLVGADAKDIMPSAPLPPSAGTNDKPPTGVAPMIPMRCVHLASTLCNNDSSKMPPWNGCGTSLATRVNTKDVMNNTLAPVVKSQTTKDVVRTAGTNLPDADIKQ